MEAVDQLDVAHEGLSILLRVLAPITPHLSEYLGQQLQLSEKGLETLGWPMPDPNALQTETITWVVAD